MQELKSDLEAKVLDPLQYVKLDSEFRALWPAEWQNLPKALQAVYEYDIQLDGSRKLAPAVYFGVKCASTVPTLQEIEELKDICVKNGRKPVAILGAMGYVMVVDFPPGLEPSMRDFFDSEFKHELGRPVAMLLIYPCLEA